MKVKAYLNGIWIEMPLDEINRLAGYEKQAMLAAHNQARIQHEVTVRPPASQTMEKVYRSIKGDKG